MTPFDRYYADDPEYYGWTPSPHLFACVDVLRSELGNGFVVDVGSGEGRDARWLASLNLDVVCVDTSLAGVQAARAVGLRVCQGSILALPCRESCAVLVNATTVLDHLQPREVEGAAAEIRRVLRPQGFVALEVFTTSDPGWIGGDVSDTSALVMQYFEPDALRQLMPDVELLYYSEGIEPDWTHGTPHTHGVARLVGRVCK